MSDHLNTSTCLLVIGMQNDILSKECNFHKISMEKIIKCINHIIKQAFDLDYQIIYAQRFHHPQHKAFKAENIESYCVIGNWGAHLSSSLYVPSLLQDSKKQLDFLAYGLDSTYHTNNAFYDNEVRNEESNLRSLLLRKKCSKLIICGINGVVHNTESGILEKTFQTAVQMNFNVQKPLNVLEMCKNNLFYQLD